MKKTALLGVFLALSLIVSTSYAFESKKEINAKGEVVSVDPLFGRITIAHDSIKDFAAQGETEFFVSQPGLLKGISHHDLVNFRIEDSNGDVTVDKIEKTGVAEPKQQGLPVGRAVQGVLAATGDAARVVTSPIAPVHDTLGEAVGATTEATGAAVEDATVPDTKSKF